VLKLRNAGDLLVDFELKLPTDMEIEIENWADKGEANEEDTRHTAILSKGLFKVYPRKGRLEAGEEMALYLQYNYTSIEPETLDRDGRHELPVLLSIKQGKTVRLMLTGTTLEPSAACLSVEEPVLSRSVPMGHPGPDVPILYQELHNDGDVSVEYEIDEAPLQELVRANYGCPVIRCLNPTGVIEPRSRHQVQWSCQPVEQKIYSVDTSLTYRPIGERVKLTKMVKMRVPLTIEVEGIPPDQDALAAAGMLSSVCDSVSRVKRCLNSRCLFMCLVAQLLWNLHRVRQFWPLGRSWCFHMIGLTLARYPSTQRPRELLCFETSRDRSRGHSAGCHLTIRRKMTAQQTRRRPVRSRGIRRTMHCAKGW